MNEYQVLSDACIYLCNLQKAILESNNDQNPSTILQEFQDKWEYYISNGILFLARLIKYYSDKLSDACAFLLNTEVSSEQSILKAMRIFEEYVKLIYQISIEIDYLETGAIHCQGHNQELLFMGASMDRKSSLPKQSDDQRAVNNILKGYIRNSTIDEVGYHEDKLKFSCLSFDGMRVLHLQFQSFFKGIKIKSPDLLYDPELENYQSLRSRLVKERYNKTGSYLSHINCIFYCKKIGREIVTYGIVS